MNPGPIFLRYYVRLGGAVFYAHILSEQLKALLVLQRFRRAAIIFKNDPCLTFQPWSLRRYDGHNSAELSEVQIQLFSQRVFVHFVIQVVDVNGL